jgi:hypothetical protein
LKFLVRGFAGDSIVVTATGFVHSTALLGLPFTWGELSTKYLPEVKAKGK